MKSLKNIIASFAAMLVLVLVIGAFASETKAQSATTCLLAAWLLDEDQAGIPNHPYDVFRFDSTHTIITGSYPSLVNSDSLGYMQLELAVGNYAYYPAQDPDWIFTEAVSGNGGKYFVCEAYATVYHQWNGVPD